MIDTRLGTDNLAKDAQRLGQTVKSNIQTVKGSLGGLSAVAKKLTGILATAFAVQKLVQFGAACIQLGSDVQEVQNVVDTAFGSMSYKMEQFADTAIMQYGMSTLAAKRTGSTYMAMARGMGVAEDAASDMAIALTGLSGDVASFYNMSQEDAAYKLQSVFTGETESLKTLGIVMTQTNLKQYALANGMDANIQSMTQAEQTALRYSYVVDQLRLASGDFARTQDSWANQTRILAMQWQEFMSIIGQTLTTVLAPVVRMLNTIVSALIKMANAVYAVIASIFGGAQQQIKDTSAAITDANTAIGSTAGSAAQGEQDLADGIADAAKAAKSGTSSIDELNVLQKDMGNSGGGGGAASGGTVSPGSAGVTIEPEYTVDPKPGLVDTIVESIQQGNWEQVGQLLAQKLNDSLAAIPWQNFEANIRQWMGNLVSVFNGFTQALDWGLMGSNIAQGLNLVLHAVDDFFQGFDWAALGTGLGAGLNQMVQTVDWTAVGHWITNQLNAAFQTLHGFVTTFDFGQLGSSLATAVMGAIGNVDWAAAMQSLSGVGVGLLTGLQNLIRSIDWASLGATVAEMLFSIDWEGLIGGLMQVLQDLAGGVLDGLNGISQWVIDNEPVFGVAAITIGAFMGLWKLVDFAAWVTNAGGVVGVLGAIKGAFEAGIVTKLADKALDLQIIGLYAKDFVVSSAKAVGALTKNTAAWVAGTAAKGANTAAQWLQIAATTAWSAACTAATAITTAFGAAVAFLTSPIGLVVIAVTALIAIIVLLVTHWDTVKAVAAAVWERIVAVWRGACDWFNTTVVQPIVNAFSALFDKVSQIAVAVWQAIVKAWQGACGWFNSVVVQPVVSAFTTLFDSVTGVFSSIINFVAGAFTGAWSGAWNGILDIVGGVWNGITSIVKGSINGIIGFINGMISAVCGAVNGIVGALNGISVTIPKWVPGIGGNHFGISLPTVSVPQIPALAQGAVLPANQPFLAMVGDQRRGTNVEAPLDTIKQAVAEVFSQMQAVQQFSASQPIEISLDGQVLYRAMSKIEANRGVRIGGAFADAY